MRVKAITRWAGIGNYDTVAFESSSGTKVFDRCFDNGELHAEGNVACVLRPGGNFGSEEDTLAAMKITEHDLVICR